MSPPPSMFESLRPGVASPPPSGYIQPTLNHGLRIWWAFFWPTTLFAILIAFTVNFAFRTLYENLKVSAAVAGPILKYDSYVISYIVAFFVMMNILRKNFRHFRVGLLTNHGGEGAVALPPTLPRVARVWWTYSWRSLIYRAIATVAVSFPLGWIIGFLAALFKGVPVIAILLGVVVSTLIDGAVGLFVIYSNILDEDLGDFRVALLPRAAPGEAIAPGVMAPPAPPAPQNLPGD